MGDTGPCGRCSEIYYYPRRRAARPRQVRPGVECGSERFVEIWNNVFMEFERQRRRARSTRCRRPRSTPAWARAHLRGHAGHAVELRHDAVHAAPGTRSPTLRRPHLRQASMSRPTSRCASSPTTARDDVPDRRRRGAVERMARLRAAQDHAPGDAARQAAGHAPSRSCTRSWTCWSREMGDAYPELRREPRRHRQRDQAARKSVSTPC